MSNTAERAVRIPEPTRDRSRAMGAILVELGRLRPNDVDEIQLFAETHGIRFGEAGLKLNLMTRDDIDFVLAQQFSYPVLERGGPNGVANELIAAYQPQNIALESLRALRSQLILRWLKDASRRVLTIASPSRGEGRSWLAANLATVFAQVGERTLLIDADMRHSRQHTLFNINNSTGLSALLTGRAGREIARRIHPQLRLFVLPAGQVPPNPQELLEREVFDVILDHFAEQFGVIIIDTPAATESADAQVLAARSGGTIMLARRNHTRQLLLSKATQGFIQAGVNVIGSVVVQH